MSWTIGTIILPHSPSRIRLSRASVVEEQEVDGGYPILVSACLGPKTLTMEGEVYKPNYTAGSLETAYIIPLGTLVGTTCPLVCPDSRYGGTWLMVGFDFEEVAEGGQAKFNYYITFKLGTETVIL